MTTLAHADVFFFVTTICAVVVTIFIIIIAAYIINILSKVHHISRRAKAEGDFFFAELREFARRLNSRRFGFVAVVRFVRRMIGRFY